MNRDPKARQRIVDRARADLAERLAIDWDEIEVRGIEQTKFRDASLGVPRAGERYAQVIISGYVVRLGAQGKVYRYHGSGNRVILAEG